MRDDIRNSQIEAETIASQEQSGLSPRTAAFSSGNNIGVFGDTRVGTADAAPRRSSHNNLINTSHRIKVNQPSDYPHLVLFL